MELHIDYEKQPDTRWIDRTRQARLPRREDAALEGQDRTDVQPLPHARGIPPEVYDYRLGNRTALEWVIDQYHVSTDKRSGIVNDPNRDDDPEYIVRLIGQVVTVSLETQRIIR